MLAWQAGPREGNTGCSKLRIVAVKKIETPDERHAFEHASLNVVNLPGVTIARTVYQPGWKWSTDVKPVVGTEACQAAHTGYIISGWLHARMGDGREYGFGPRTSSR